jgi:hypothetical protein
MEKKFDQLAEDFGIVGFWCDIDKNFTEIGWTREEEENQDVMGSLNILIVEEEFWDDFSGEYKPLTSKEKRFVEELDRLYDYDNPY